MNIPETLKNRLCTAQEAAALIPSGAVVAASGYTAVGDPKATLLALAERAKAENGASSGGDAPFLIDLISAAQLSKGVENALADAGALRLRAPFTVASGVSGRANRGELHYVETAMSKMPRLVESGAFGEIDFAVAEVCAAEADGRVYPTTSVGMTQQFCRQAKHIILEVNAAQPASLIGLHDVYEHPQHAGACLEDPLQRVGRPFMQIDPDKICAVVVSDIPDELPAKAEPSGQETRICANLMDLLTREYAGKPLPPIQTGIGSLSMAILAAFQSSPFEDLRFFCGALQEGMMDLLDSGRASCLSGGSLSLGEEARKRLAAAGPDLAKKLVLRSMEVANGAAAAGSLGILALNTGIEADMFGNVNSAHISGSRLVSGLGGGATFAANAGLSVLLLPSVKKDGAISSFVPTTPHVDIVHHDIDVVVSEHGVADLRGKDDVSCAREIIASCADPSYRAALAAELEAAMTGGGHHPVGLAGGFSWHARLKETGSMR